MSKLLSLVAATAKRLIPHRTIPNSTTRTLSTLNLARLRDEAHYIGGGPGSWGVVDLNTAIRTDNLQYCVALYFVGEQRAAMLHTAADFDKEKDIDIMQQIIAMVNPNKIIVTSSDAYVSTITSSGNFIGAKSAESRQETLQRIKLAYERIGEELPKIEERRYSSNFIPKGMEVVGCNGDSASISPSKSIILRALEAITPKHVARSTDQK